jgi:hypothetical protein
MQLAEYESKYGAPPGDDFDDIAATDDDADTNDVQGNDLDDIAVPEHQEEVWEQPVITCHVCHYCHTCLLSYPTGLSFLSLLSYISQNFHVQLILEKKFVSLVSFVPLVLLMRRKIEII